MARIRTIKPDFWGSPKTAKVSRDARLLFLGLLNEADDEGRLLSSAKKIAGSIFPHDDNVQPRQVGVWLAELRDAGFIVLYEADGIGLCSIIGFTEHQKVSHPTPSKFPAPPENFANDSRTAPENFVPEQGTGNREQGTGKATVVAVPDTSCSFDDFWTAYPRKTAKATARKAWKQAARKTDPQVIFDGACRYRDDPNREDAFTKHPATWLNGECWLDEPLPSRQRSGLEGIAAWLGEAS